MRLTQVLMKHPIRYHMKKVWKRKGYVVEPKIMIPEVLKAKGVEVVDAADAYFPAPQKVSPDDWVPSVAKDPRWYVKQLRDHPDYKETPILEYNWRTRMVEGEKQALILTKTQPFEGLPETITRNIGAVEIPNTDVVVQRAIMQSNKWDAAMERLPRRFNREIPGWSFKAEIGIPAKRRCEILAANLLRIIRQTGGKYPDLAHSLRTVKDPYVSTYFHHNGMTQITVRGVAGTYMTYTDRRLPAHAPQEVVTSSETQDLPDLFPVSPLVDLAQEHIWRDENVTGLRPGCSHQFPHTMYMSHRKHWSTSQRRSQALMFTFAHSLACAKSLYGPEPQVLPQPIVMNCVHTNNCSFDFLTFQLNTTDLTSSSGIKNMVWWDSENTLYERAEPKRAMLRNTSYHDYDPQVFDKLVALHLYGLDLNTTWSDLERKLEQKQEAVTT